MSVLDRMKSLFLGGESRKKNITFVEISNELSPTKEKNESHNENEIEASRQNNHEKNFYEPTLKTRTTPSVNESVVQDEDSSASPIKLTYRADEIISINSPFLYHQRSLKSVERFFKEKEYDMATQIYERLLGKIPSKTIQGKIKKNLEDINQISEHQEKMNPEAETKTDFAETNPQQIESSLANQIIQHIAQSTMEVREALFQAQQIEALTKENLEKSKPSQEESHQPNLEVDKSEDGKLSDSSFEKSRAIQVHQEEKLEGTSLHSDRVSHGTEKEKVAVPPKKKEIDPIDVKQETSDSTKDSSDQVLEKEDTTKNEAKEQASSKESVTEKSDTESTSEESSASSKESSSQMEGKTGFSRETDEIEEPEEDNNFLEEAIQGLEKDQERSTEEGNKKETIPQTVHGVFDIKLPEPEDSASLSLTYDFTKTPYSFHLSKDNQFFEYSYYKYKPMLIQAHKFIRSKQIAKALNYYKTINDQEIPNELRGMIEKNMEDINDFITKYFS